MTKTHCLAIIVFLTVFINFSVQAQVYPTSNFTLISVISPETGTNSDGDKYSACWGWYQASKLKEYAIAGSQSGTYWVDVTNPATPTVSAFRAGAVTGAIWREMKTYQNYCYVISDDNGSNSLQIFDMQYLPDSVHKVYDSQALLKRGHTLWVDGNKLYVAAVTYSNNNFSSMNVYSLVNPEIPVLLRSLEQDFNFINYVHDMYVRNDTIFASCGYQGLYVFKFNSGNTFTMLGSLLSYPGSGFNHSSALTPNGKTLVFTDEVPDGLPIKTANVSNLANIQVLATTNQYPATTPHNPFIVNDQYCFVSSYQEGLQLYDISNPSAPKLAGYFDTYPQGGGNTGNWGSDPYQGQWGAYPYFPSKNIFALDQNNGIFMLKTIIGNFKSIPKICQGAATTPTINTYNANTYTWTFPGGTPSVSSIPNPTVSYATAGVYSITLLSDNGTNSVTVTNTINILPNTLVSNTSFTNSACSSCSTGIASVSVSGGTSPYSYSWSPVTGTSTTLGNLAPACYTVMIKDANACLTSTQACISVYDVTGLQILSLQNDLLVYPNPAQNQLTIDYSACSFNYSLHNNLGQLVSCQSNLQGKQVIQLNHLKAGIYLLEVEDGKNKLRKKIIIER